MQIGRYLDRSEEILTITSIVNDEVSGTWQDSCGKDIAFTVNKREMKSVLERWRCVPFNFSDYVKSL